MLTFRSSGDGGTKESVSESISRQDHELVDGVRLKVVYAHRRRRVAARYHSDSER